MTSNQNTTIEHKDAIGNELKIGDRVLYRTRMGSWTELGVVHSFTATAMRVVPEDWEIYTGVLQPPVDDKSLPKLTVPKHLGINVEALEKDQKMFARWDKLKTPLEIIKQSI